MRDVLNLNEFFDTLEFTTHVEYLSKTQSKSDAIYSINGENVIVEFKSEIRPQHIPLFDKKETKKLAFLVAAKYITPNAKLALKNSSINYIDSFGNVFLDLKNLKLYIEKNNSKPVYKSNTKIFTQAGCQLVFQLLKHPESINETVRYLAHQSNVSLGSISKIINHLQEEGYVIKWNKELKYQLVKREELLEQWISPFVEKVLPNYKIGNFKFSQHQLSDWHKKLFYPGLFWGSEPAASILTKTKQDVIQQFRLIPDEIGEITIYNKFWIDKNTMGSLLNYMDEKNIVPPLLIYSELIYSGNQRNIETAKIIFDAHIFSLY